MIDESAFFDGEIVPRSFTVRGLPADDFPLHGKLGWGLGSRVQSKTTGVVGVSVGAVAHGRADPLDPSEWAISVRITGANGLRGLVSLPCEDLVLAPR